ncbi:putative nuclease HARBI1, partial [Aphis craccivora]
VLVCLHFYAQGSYQKGLGGISILNISQPSCAERQRARENFAHTLQPFEGTIGANT